MSRKVIILVSLFSLLLVILPANNSSGAVLFDCSIQTSIPITECNALLDLYTAANGDQWIDATNWLVNEDPCTWFGVTCSAGHVTEIDLELNGLTGSIPSSLGSFSSLEFLNLINNDLAGEIPVNLTYLTQLNHLWLGGNQLSGEIPANIGNLQNLEGLNLAYNQLTGSIPSELGNLLSLIFILLQGNSITGSLPPEIGNLVNLTDLWVDHNKLSGPIPYEYMNLELEGFMYDYTMICHHNEPEFLSWLTSIPNASGTGISCTYCEEQSGIPLSECEGLKSLYGSTEGYHWTNSDGWMYGEDPCTWFGVTCSAGHVIEIDLENNGLAGPIPATLENLSNLEYLGLRNNDLVGEIPVELMNLIQLKYLRFGRNQLSGEIPANIGNLQNLEGLDLGYNQLVGIIPVSVSTILPLQFIHVPGNSLTGTLPPELGYLNNLIGIWVDQNNLSGPIPYEYMNLELAGFTYFHTMICHHTDPEFWDWLISIPNVDGTGISCTCCEEQSGIPLSECEVLKSLYYSTEGHYWENASGWLSGEDPCGWYGISCIEGHVTGIDLFENGLNGPIIDSFDDLPYLEHLNLALNNLQGNIPEDLSNLGQLNYLALGANNLGGTIPATYGNLVNLEFLELGPNASVTGTVPPELGNLSLLKDLYLGDTALSGPIPLEFVNLGQLESFHYLGTDLCVLRDLEFLEWLNSIDDLVGTWDRCDVTGPVVSIISPAAGGSMLKPKGQIIVDAVDDDSGMDRVEFFIDSNGSWEPVGVDQDGGDGWRMAFSTAYIDQDAIYVKVVAYDSAGNPTPEEIGPITMADGLVFVFGYEARGGAGGEGGDNPLLENRTMMPQDSKPKMNTKWFGIRQYPFYRLMIQLH